jgi:uncharacterized membrane protein YdjX (TVP38/TMEM64 family)
MTSTARVAASRGFEGALAGSFSLPLELDALLSLLPPPLLLLPLLPALAPLLDAPLLLDALPLLSSPLLSSSRAGLVRSLGACPGRARSASLRSRALIAAPRRLSRLWRAFCGRATAIAGTFGAPTRASVSAPTRAALSAMSSSAAVAAEEGAGSPRPPEAAPAPWWAFWSWSRASKLKLLVGVALAVLVVVAFAVLDAGKAFGDMLTWFRDHRTEGSFLFVLLYIVATVLLVPGSILTLGAGFIYPFFLALAIVTVGASVGLVLAFWLGRYLFRDALNQHVRRRYPRFDFVEKAISREGGKIILLLRLSPITPFNVFNYLCGLTSVDTARYTAASVVGIIPGTAMFVYFGSLARDISEVTRGDAHQSRATTIAISVVSGVLIIAAAVFSAVVAKRALRASLERAESDSEAAAAVEQSALEARLRRSSDSEEQQARDA